MEINLWPCGSIHRPPRWGLKAPKARLSDRIGRGKNKNGNRSLGVRFYTQATPLGFEGSQGPAVRPDRGIKVIALRPSAEHVLEIPFPVHRPAQRFSIDAPFSA